MCFTNDGEKLKRFRNRKRAITVWKRGNIDGKTGFVTTGNCNRRVIWKLGEKVVPDRIRKPLRNGGECSSGLYFYTSKKPNFNGYGSVQIAARVDPKDIIAVSGDNNHDGEMICCVKAKVVQAPNPDQRQMRIKYLTSELRDAHQQMEVEDEQIKAWTEKRADKDEAVQNMKAEIADLKNIVARKGKKRTK